MKDHPDYTTMSASEMLESVRDDAAKWAAAFIQMAEKLGHNGIDEGWMIGWFANAIECSHAVRSERPTEQADFWSDVSDPEVTDASPDNILCADYAQGHVVELWGHGINTMYGFWFEPEDGSDFQYRYFSDENQALEEAKKVLKK